MFRGAQRCDKVGSIVSKWELCDAGGKPCDLRRVSIARVEALRVEGNVRCAEQIDLVARRSRKKK